MLYGRTISLRRHTHGFTITSWTPKDGHTAWIFPAEFGRANSHISVPSLRLAHPYTQALLAAVPRPEVGVWEGTLLQGEPPRPDALPSGCRLRLCCPYAQDDPCMQHEPALAELMPGQQVACHYAPRTAVAASGHTEQAESARSTDV